MPDPLYFRIIITKGHSGLDPESVSSVISSRPEYGSG